MRRDFAAGNWKPALAAARELRNALPDDPERLRIEAACLVQAGNPREASDILRRLADKDTTDLDLRLALARALLLAGSPSEARTVLDALRRHPLATAEQRDQAMGMLVGMEMDAPDSVESPLPDPETAAPLPQPPIRDSGSALPADSNGPDGIDNRRRGLGSQDRSLGFGPEDGPVGTDSGPEGRERRRRDAVGTGTP